MIKALKKINITNPETAKFQNNVEEVLSRILSCPIIDGVLLKNIELVVGQDNEVSHGLGREYVGFSVIKPKSQAIVWESANPNNKKNLTINLQAAQTCIVDIWMF